MSPIVKKCTTALALVAMTGQALAGACARPNESMALRAAAVQQELMVAALYCHDVGLYNKFVIAYQKQLQDSDATMKMYFHRANAATGEADYHAYKTRLANGFSLTSLHGMDSYCHNAGEVFDAALEGGQSLNDVVSALPDARGDDAFDCTETASMGGSLLDLGGGSGKGAARNH
jgi:hypothetical protein